MLKEASEAAMCCPHCDGSVTQLNGSQVIVVCATNPNECGTTTVVLAKEAAAKHPGAGAERMSLCGSSR